MPTRAQVRIARCRLAEHGGTCFAAVFERPDLRDELRVLGRVEAGFGVRSAWAALASGRVSKAAKVGRPQPTAADTMCVDRRPFLADPIEASRCTADRMVARCHRAVVVGKKSNLLLCHRLAEQPRRSASAFESAPVGGGAKRVAWVVGNPLQERAFSSSSELDAIRRSRAPGSLSLSRQSATAARSPLTFKKRAAAIARCCLQGQHRGLSADVG